MKFQFNGIAKVTFKEFLNSKIKDYCNFKISKLVNYWGARTESYES